jgi:hypothetical protein
MFPSRGSVARTFMCIAALIAPNTSTTIASANTGLGRRAIAAHASPPITAAITLITIAHARNIDDAS